MAADEEIMCRMRRTERFAVEHRIQLHQFRTLQIVQCDVQTVTGVEIHAMTVVVGHGGGHRIVLVGVGGVVAFRQHHVEQVILRRNVMVERRLGDADLVGYVLQAHAPESFGGDDFDGRLEDLQVPLLLTHALFLLEGLARQCVARLSAIGG